MGCWFGLDRDLHSVGERDEIVPQPRRQDHQRDAKTFHGQFEVDFISGYTVLDFDGVVDAAGQGEFKFTKLVKTTDGLRRSVLAQNIIGLKGGVMVDGRLAIGKYLHAIAGKPTAPPRVITFELKRKE